jgi:quinol monooxygenase YgiN
MAQSAHILRFTAKADSADDLVAVFQHALPHIHDDPMTVSWFVGRSEDDPATFVLAHVFQNEAARSAHFSGPAATLIMSEGGPLFASEPKIENVSFIAGATNAG